MKILINALTAKKQSGGGFQIAANFIISTLLCKDVEWLYLVSKDIDEVIRRKDYQIKNGAYFVFEPQPDFFYTYWKVRKKIREIERQYLPDIVYSITSPSYFKFETIEVMRFANAWITNPNQYAWKTLSFYEKIYMFLYSINQKRLMKKRKYFITQTETVKKGIQRITNLDSENIKVVPNVLPAFFSRLAKKNIFASEKDTINVACVAAPFKHKNIEIIVDILEALRDCYNINNVVFFVTIPKENSTWLRIQLLLNKRGFEKNVVNYGYCSQKRLVELYSRCELFLFPSLLETFSASLLEAMFFSLVPIVSDFDFNKEVTKDCALYFQPMDGKDAASKIARLISYPEERNILLSRTFDTLMEYASYELHFSEILKFLIAIAERKK